MLATLISSHFKAHGTTSAPKMAPKCLFLKYVSMTTSYQTFSISLSKHYRRKLNFKIIIMFRGDNSHSLSYEQQAKFIQDRITNVERNFGDLCVAFGDYARKTARYSTVAIAITIM